MTIKRNYVIPMGYTCIKHVSIQKQIINYTNVTAGEI